MATTKEPWPLLYGGWQSYREWADHGFVPKDTGKRHGRHKDTGSGKRDGEPEDSDEKRAPEEAARPVPVLPAPPAPAALPGPAAPPPPRTSPGYFAPSDPPAFGGPPTAGPAAVEPAPLYEHRAMPVPDPPFPQEPEAPAPSALRPYIMTSGRTRTRRDLAVHALVSTTGHGHAAANRQLPEQRAICLLCSRPHSVAEVSASLSVPLGVVRVLIDDMAHQGLVVVHGLQSGGNSMELLSRVLDGLHRL